MSRSSTINSILLLGMLWGTAPAASPWTVPRLQGRVTGVRPSAVRSSEPRHGTEGDAAIASLMATLDEAWAARDGASPPRPWVDGSELEYDGVSFITDQDTQNPVAAPVPPHHGGVDWLDRGSGGYWEPVVPYGLATRFAWWSVDNDGSPNKTGEFQGLESSPFWDVDGLSTDGRRTLDFDASGPGDEATQVGIRYFGPLADAEVEYEEFLRRFVHEPLDNIHDVRQQSPGGDLIVKEDLDVAEDYAIRVQELKGEFAGHLTRNLKWKLNVHNLRRKGQRQVMAMAHCFNHPAGMDINGNPVLGSSCHLQTQGQQVDWSITEVEPALETQIGPAILEYSRTMRTFSQNDEMVTRPYDRFGFNGDLPYAVVPENYTDIDRVRLNLALLKGWDVYANAYNGNTLNRDRRTNRRLWGWDLRTTARTTAGTSLTGYTKRFVQTNQAPPFLLPNETAASIRTPVNYDWLTAGLKGRWRPFYGEDSLRSRLLVTGGYEYRGLSRENAVFVEPAATVEEAQTTENWVYLRTSLQWASDVQSHVRYKFGFVEDPLYGIAKNGTTNSALPTQAHVIEVGSTWTPMESFLLTTTVGIENSWHSSEVADFAEDNYPILVTAWYAPTDRWSLSGGLAFFSNWIDQDITLGALGTTVTTDWNYSGRSEVINLAGTYRLTNRVLLTSGFDFVRGRNGFETPGLPYELSPFSDVLIETTRLYAGVDYELRPGVATYFRYQFFDYEDKSEGFNSGTANMLLGGITALY